MKQTFFVLVILTLFSCTQSKKDRVSVINDKKIELQKLRKEQQKINKDIAKLEAEIASAEPGRPKGTPKLVSTIPLSAGSFTHYIELQGKVDAENISYVSPRGMPAQVKALYVKKGDFVRKGQLLMKLDDGLVQTQIASVQSQLSYARDLYQRQLNLWKQDIGTEVQVLNAKNNVNALEKQLATLREQQSFSNVYAQVSGIADEVNIRVGETFSGNPVQGIKIVNTNSLKIVANVPENYITRVKKGAPVEILLPDANRTLTSSISLISQSIDPTMRGFTAEAPIPPGGGLKPNQVAQMKILDYATSNVISVPVNVIQNDEKGKYVFVLVKEKDRTVARKKMVNLGESYGGYIEVKYGLNSGDILITEGYQNLYDNQLVKVATP